MKLQHAAASKPANLTERHRKHPCWFWLLEGVNVGTVYVGSVEEADRLMDAIRVSAKRFHDWFAAQSGDPLDLLKRMKFEQVGFHPIEHRPLNLVEQINQLWTHAVAVSAAQQLLELHPNAGGFHLAPGAHAAQALDIMSGVDGLVGAETFAAVDPNNNKKLAFDLNKLSGRSERFRYCSSCLLYIPKTSDRTHAQRPEPGVLEALFVRLSEGTSLRVAPEDHHSRRDHVGRLLYRDWSVGRHSGSRHQSDLARLFR